MKVYIAGKFGDKALVLEAFARIRELGHSIAYDWTTHKNIQPYAQNQGTARAYSENELAGIADCDVFIYLSSDGGHTLHMEFGSALMLARKAGKPMVYAVGEFNDRSPWFFNGLVRRRDTIDEVIAELRGAQ